MTEEQESNSSSLSDATDKVLYNPFCVVEHWRLRVDQREDCLSDSEFHSARTMLKRAETPQANTAGWPFFWYLFFGHSKKRYSPKKGEKQMEIQ